MVGLPGSIWVDGTDLHYISETGTERKATGSNSGSVAGLAGSIWIEGTQLAYIDNTQTKRILPYTALSTVAGLNGSIWVGGEWIHYIVGGIEQEWHTDADPPHSNSLHGDGPSQYGYSDDPPHNNYGHTDAYPSPADIRASNTQRVRFPDASVTVGGHTRAVLTSVAYGLNPPGGAVVGSWRCIFDAYNSSDASWSSIQLTFYGNNIAIGTSWQTFTSGDMSNAFSPGNMVEIWCGGNNSSTTTYYIRNAWMCFDPLYPNWNWTNNPPYSDDPPHTDSWGDYPWSQSGHSDDPPHTDTPST